MSLKINQQCRRSTAFTLVELLVVILIIGILMAILVAGFAGIRSVVYRQSTNGMLRSTQSVLDEVLSVEGGEIMGPIPDYWGNWKSHKGALKWGGSGRGGKYTAWPQIAGPPPASAGGTNYHDSNIPGKRGSNTAGFDYKVSNLPSLSKNNKMSYWRHYGSSVFMHNNHYSEREYLRPLLEEMRDDFLLKVMDYRGNGNWPSSEYGYWRNASVNSHFLVDAWGHPVEMVGWSTHENSFFRNSNQTYFVSPGRDGQWGDPSADDEETLWDPEEENGKEPISYPRFILDGTYVDSPVSITAKNVFSNQWDARYEKDNHYSIHIDR